jgi:hypothetical protein
MHSGKHNHSQPMTCRPDTCLSYACHSTLACTTACACNQSYTNRVVFEHVLNTPW